MTAFCDIKKPNSSHVPHNNHSHTIYPSLNVELDEVQWLYNIYFFKSIIDLNSWKKNVVHTYLFWGVNLSLVVFGYFTSICMYCQFFNNLFPYWRPYSKIDTCLIIEHYFCLITCDKKYFFPKKVARFLSLQIISLVDPTALKLRH